MEKWGAAIILFIFFLRGLGAPGRFELDLAKLNFTFTFYNRNCSSGVRLNPGESEGLTASGFKGSLPTKIIAHGFLSNGNATWIMRVKEGQDDLLKFPWRWRTPGNEPEAKTEVFKIEDANVIIFDWSSCAKNVLYMEVVECVNLTSRHVGSFIKFLEKEGNLDLEKTYLIGHSLGAQILGLATSVYPPKTIGRITGLDPAGPLFEDAEVRDRLNPNRAKMVDIIHTCIYFVGMKKPLGTFDFYPNGGFNQPACAVFDLGCHHRQSHEYFIDSFTNRNKYVAHKCKSLRQALGRNCNGASGSMGYFITNSPPGIYHLEVK